jgi:predicted nucleotidyltransferase
MSTTVIPELVAARLAEIRSVAVCFGVDRLELFGSFARGDDDLDISDLDFLVTLPLGYDLGPWMGRYFDLKTALTDIFRRPVDLVIDGDIRNPIVLKSVNESRIVLYER